MTAIRDPYRNYRQTQIETADQATLLLMLYSGALKHLRLGREAMGRDDVEETNHQLGRAQDILCELMGSLNPDVPEISSNLFQLYEYMHHRLVQANIKKERALVEEVEKMLGNLLEAWEKVVRQEKEQAALATPEAPGERRIDTTDS